MYMEADYNYNEEREARAEIETRELAAEDRIESLRREELVACEMQDRDDELMLSIVKGWARGQRLAATLSRRAA